MTAEMDDATIRQMSLSWKRPYDAERVGQLSKMLVEARKRKLSAGLRARGETKEDRGR